MSLYPASSRRIAVTAAIVLHVGAAIFVLSLRPSPITFAPPAPIGVQLITPDPIEPSEPKPVAPKIQPPTKPTQKPAVQKIVQPDPPPVFAATPTTAEPPGPAAPSFVLETVAPPLAIVAATPSGTMPKAAPTPAPVTPPSFNADYLHNPAPAYPAMSRRLGEAGRVVLRVFVTTVGTAERVELRTSSGSKRLDSAALEAVQRWKFVPARQGETPVAAWVLIPILFTLES